jgi:WD40 repeat protein
VRTLSFPGAVVAAALSPDRRLVAVAARKRGRVTTSLIDVGTRRVRATLRERGVDALAFSPDGSLLATGSTDRTARLWRVPSGRLVHLLPQRGHVVAVRFSPRGRSLVTSSTDGSAAVWSVRRGIRMLLLTGSTGAATDAAFSPDGKYVAVAFTDEVARLYDATDGRLLAPLAGHGGPVTSIEFDARSRTIVTGSADGTVRLWSATAGDELVPIDRRPQPVTARFVTDTIVRTVAGRTARDVTVDGRVVHTSRAAGARPQPARSPNGKLIAMIHGREVDLRDARSGRVLRRLARQRSAVTDAEFSPDGRYVVTASDDHLARIYDARSGALVHVLVGHFFPVYAASFSPDGRWVVTASQFTAGLWNAQTGALVQYLRGHTKPLTGASFSPDGRWIVTGSKDGVASVVRCEICAGLSGLEQVARARLASLR